MKRFRMMTLCSKQREMFFFFFFLNTNRDVLLFTSWPHVTRDAPTGQTARKGAAGGGGGGRGGSADCWTLDLTKCCRAHTLGGKWHRSHFRQSNHRHKHFFSKKGSAERMKMESHCLCCSSVRIGYVSARIVAFFPYFVAGMCWAS